MSSENVKVTVTKRKFSASGEATVISRGNGAFWPWILQRRKNNLQSFKKIRKTPVMAGRCAVSAVLHVIHPGPSGFTVP
jgi:hypothetical protein